MRPFDTDKFDELPFADAKAFAATKDYITVNRASPDRNAWSRYNCWYHKDVILASESYNSLPTTLDESTRAKRPIIEYDADLELFNYGTNGKRFVDIIDTTETDALSNVNGKIGYLSDTVALTPGRTVVFTQDPDTRQNIYQVRRVDEDENASTEEIIVLERIDTI